ncbi:hypothetical protein [Silvanigrella sp.]|jgi:hypothetical protein|uniref:hypothetical protein n=1 Tax=Silvanigrella sp. TaxID=2024976 RepID=UPI0037C5835E
MNKNEEIKHVKIIEEIIEQYVLKSDFQREQFKKTRSYVYLKEKSDEIKEEIKKIINGKDKQKLILLDKKYVDVPFLLSTKYYIEITEGLNTEIRNSENDKENIELIISKKANKKTKKEKTNEFIIVMDVF